MYLGPCGPHWQAKEGRQWTGTERSKKTPPSRSRPRRPASVLPQWPTNGQRSTGATRIRIIGIAAPALPLELVTAQHWLCGSVARIQLAPLTSASQVTAIAAEVTLFFPCLELRLRLVQREGWILVEIKDDVTEKLCVYDRLM